MKSPFSFGVHSRSSTHSQFLLNHFSTFFGSVNLSLFTAGDIGSMILPTMVLPCFEGSAVWQVVPDLSSFSGNASFWN